MDLNKFIEKNDIPFNQNEVQGYLMGLLVCNIGENFKLEFVKFIGKNVYDSLPEINALDLSIAQTINSLINNSLTLSFDEHVNLENQLEGMAHWVTYFILAINISVDNKYIKNSLQIQELLFDFQEITRSHDNYFIDNEVDDREHYDTIKEYILNSVYSIYNFVRESDAKE